MKCYYPTDKSGNRIGFKTPEACIFDTSGKNLTNKLNQLRSDVNGKAAANHGTHVPAPQAANNKIYLRNDNTWHTITPGDIGAAASSHSHSWDSITGKPSLYTTSQIDSKISEINSNINSAKTEVITKFTIVDFSSYIPNGSLRVNTIETLTIPGISNYQYIKCVSSSDQLFGGFATIHTDGEFNCALATTFSDDMTGYCVQRVHGKVSGDTLTLYPEGTCIAAYKSTGISKPATYVAGDNYTITSILCLGKK